MLQNQNSFSVSNTNSNNNNNNHNNNNNNTANNSSNPSSNNVRHPRTFLPTTPPTANQLNFQQQQALPDFDSSPNFSSHSRRSATPPIATTTTTTTTTTTSVLHQINQGRVSSSHVNNNSFSVVCPRTPDLTSSASTTGNREGGVTTSSSASLFPSSATTSSSSPLSDNDHKNDDNNSHNNNNNNNINHHHHNNNFMTNFSNRFLAPLLFLIKHYLNRSAVKAVASFALIFFILWIFIADAITATAHWATTPSEWSLPKRELRRWMDADFSALERGFPDGAILIDSPNYVCEINEWFWNVETGKRIQEGSGEKCLNEFNSDDQSVVDPSVKIALKNLKETSRCLHENILEE